LARERRQRLQNGDAGAGLRHVRACACRRHHLSVSATAPVANQSITAWLRAAVPSYSAEGAFFLWDKVTTNYLAATPALFLQFLEATAGENGVSWWTSTGGPPLNTVGNNGDFAIRTDSPGGFYGPKVAGAWPVTPIPGTVDTVTSTSLDNAFGATPGQIIRRGAAAWEALAIGAANQLLSVAAGLPEWATLSALMDTLFGTAQGSVMYRDAARGTRCRRAWRTKCWLPAAPGEPRVGGALR
jgi:hypothetical protein